MPEYAGAGDGARLMMLVLHDEARREYAYGPAQGVPETKVGRLRQELYDEGKKKYWTLISTKTDWKRMFSFESKRTSNGYCRNAAHRLTRQINTKRIALQNSQKRGIDVFVRDENSDLPRNGNPNQCRGALLEHRSCS